MKINRYILLVVIVFAFFQLNSNTPKNHKIVFTEQGYSPQVLYINKNESVTFSASVQYDFWPAANPHPSHNSYSEFDPKNAVKSDGTWTYTFDKSGSWPYHDHINPNYRGLINVKETNWFILISKKTKDYWNKKFVKHDKKYLDKIAIECGISKSQDRNEFEKCWNDFFSDLTKSFGPEESLRVLEALSKGGVLALSDCHNFADDIGSESYWQYTSNQKFDFTDQFGVCGYGFFHGFMLEHVSHGQDFESSEYLCNSLTMSQKESIRQCYVGMGSGITYFFLNSFINSKTEDTKIAEKIVTNSIAKCEILEKGRDDCIYGVYGGLEHMYLGAHGASLKIDIDNPYSICAIENNYEYSVYCHEKVTRPLFGELNNDIGEIGLRINSIRNFQIRRYEAKNIGNLISQFQIYSDRSVISDVLNKCNLFPKSLTRDCLNGAIEGVISNLHNIGQLSSFNCGLSGVQQEAVVICSQIKSEVLSGDNSI